VTIRPYFDDLEPLPHYAACSPSRGDMPRELEEAIDRSTREEFEAEFRRLCALRLLYRNGGINMSDEMRTGEGKARILEERDVPDILEVLLAEEGSPYRKDPGHIKRHLTRVAKGGLDKYENNLVAERDGKAVGRAVIDTPYPPYAELAGLLVHPEYRGRGVGTELVEGCVSLARRCDCDIMYLMACKDDPAVHRFYKRCGFQPALLQGFEEDDKEICLFRFADTPYYNEFLKGHPMSIFSVSGGKADFHGNKAFEMRWSDPLTGDLLAFYLDGDVRRRMPRITGIARKENSRAFDAWINLISSDMAAGRTAEYEVCVENKGGDKMKLHIDHLLPKGTTIDGRPSYALSSELAGEARWKLRFDIAQGFDVPPLSFYTVLATCQLQINGFSSPFYMSAGFEVERP
jgi:N-acetylglutamate synthase-like GNAT family acetyltransferase